MNPYMGLCVFFDGKRRENNMKLENYEMHLPSYSIGDKIYDKIGPVCESYGKTVLVIGGKRAGSGL